MKKGIVLSFVTVSFLFANVDSSLLSKIENKAKELKEGSKIAIKIDKNLDKNFKGEIDNIAFYGYNDKNREIIIYKPKKKNYKCAKETMNEEGDIEEAFDICSDEIDESLTTVKGLDERLAQKEQQVRAKEQQVRAKEQQVRAKEKLKYLAIQSLDFNEGILFLLKNYKKLEVKKVKQKLVEIDKIITNYEVIGDEKERNNILLGLNTLKTIYSKNKKIVSLIDNIIKKVKQSKLNKKIAKP